MPKIVSPPIRLPRERLRPAWRAAVLAYRRTRQAGLDHHAADAAAVEALRQVLPEMPEREAVQQVIYANRLRGARTHALVLEGRRPELRPVMATCAGIVSDSYRRTVSRCHEPW